MELLKKAEKEGKCKQILLQQINSAGSEISKNKVQLEEFLKEKKQLLADGLHLIGDIQGLVVKRRRGVTHMTIFFKNIIENLNKAMKERVHNLALLEVVVKDINMDVSHNETQRFECFLIHHTINRGVEPMRTNASTALSFMMLFFKMM
ncbi:hypothetical protein SDJN02_24406, partial [Cucurbita argyrosperma subsp. argyrosperma]